MTQPETFVTSQSAEISKPGSLWVAGAVILGVVFVPALIAGVINLIVLIVH